MNSRIHCLEFCVLYAGWIPMVLYLVKRRVSVCRDTILLLATEAIFSGILLSGIQIFNEFKVWYLFLGAALGGVAFAMEYVMGMKKKAPGCDSTKYKLSRMQFLAIICIPVVEEIYFRAAILQWVYDREIQQGNKGMIFVLISAGCVVVNHYQCFRDRILWMQKFFVEGILFSCIYLFAGTIWITLVGHVFFNVLNCLLFYDMGEQSGSIRRRLYEKN